MLYLFRLRKLLFLLKNDVEVMALLTFVSEALRRFQLALERPSSETKKLCEILNSISDLEHTKGTNQISNGG